MGKVSRRQFLAASMVAAVPSLMSKEAWGAGLRNMRLKGIGVIGCGERGVELTKRLMTFASSVQVRAVCDAYAPRCAEVSMFKHTDAMNDWHEMMARTDIDAVVIATPDHWHAPMAIAAMQKGKDVYCETPMAVSLRDARAFRDCALQTDCIAQIGSCVPVANAWQTARTIIEKGAIGDVVWAQGGYKPQAVCEISDTGSCDLQKLNWNAFHGGSTARTAEYARFQNWRGYWDYSLGLAAHHQYDELAGLLYAIDVRFPERVSAAGGLYRRDGRETPDSFVMTAEYTGGRNVVLASGMTCTQAMPPVIRGTKGSLAIHDDAVELTTDIETKRIKTTPACDALTAWIDALETRRTDVTTIEHHYRVQVAASMATEAYRTGKSVQFDAKQHIIKPSSSRIPCA